MKTIVHEGEGVLFLNEDGTYSGPIMLGGKTYDLRGIQGTGVQSGRQYIQLSSRERTPAASGRSHPSPLPARSPRTHKLDAALREVERKYGKTP